MSNFLKILIFTFLLMLSSNAYSQNCNYSVSANQFVGEIQPQQQSVAHSFSITRPNNNINCRNFKAYFSKGGANSYNREASQGSKTVNYNLYKEAPLNNVLKEKGDATSNEYISGNIPTQNDSYDFNFFVKLIDLDSVFSNGPGYYNDLIEIRIYAIKKNGSEVYQRTIFVNIQIIIPRYAELSLGPANFSHDPSSTQHLMFFGQLNENDEKEATLNLRGNVGFGVYMSSQNGSALVNQSSQVPYQIKVGSNNYTSLSNPGQSYYITQRNNGLPPGTTSYPIKVKIGAIPLNAESGNYADVITVTISVY